MKIVSQNVDTYKEDFLKPRHEMVDREVYLTIGISHKNYFKINIDYFQA